MLHKKKTHTHLYKYVILTKIMMTGETGITII